MLAHHKSRMKGVIAKLLNIFVTDVSNSAIVHLEFKRRCTKLLEVTGIDLVQALMFFEEGLTNKNNFAIILSLT
jgi:hypothetical protein